ncbi:hypothetical protein Bca52824_088282 [Brassica carinata]|uniref:Coiled-coil domain-containing protein SCD2 n=1 Tax=Brassica carinata TaxID=52824 RepID=A0A8X7TP21_BRACI|nr:hypothetical protein Bca52824_088282 [Brassica carinata]
MARRRWEGSDNVGSANSSPAMSPSHRMSNNGGGGISGRSTLRKQNAAELLAKVMEQRDYDYDYDDEDEDLYQVHLPPLSRDRRRDDKRIGKGTVRGKPAPAKRPVLIPPKFDDDESDGDEPVKIPQKNVRVPATRATAVKFDDESDGDEPVKIPQKNVRVSAVRPVLLPPKFDDESDGDEVAADLPRNQVKIPENNASVQKEAPAVKPIALSPPKFDDELDGDEITANVVKNQAGEIPQKNASPALRVRVPAYSRRNPMEDSEQNGDRKVNVQFDVPPAKQSEAQLKYKKSFRFSSADILAPNQEEDDREASALRDELDMLQEENDNILYKLQRAGEKREAAEARARELERQIASLGEGANFDVKLLKRFRILLNLLQAALRAAEQKRDGRHKETDAFCAELQSLKEETEKAVEQLQDAQAETKSLRTMIHRTILTHEEMEEVVLKRCWLARYWELAVQHGIYKDIAPSRHEHWSALAPLPFEVVISAAQKPEDSWQTDGSDRTWSKVVSKFSDANGEGNIESMLAVETGLREIASLKVEDAIMLVFAGFRQKHVVRQSDTDPRVQGEPKFAEAFELSHDEKQDILFKEAWLMYYWKRAKIHSVESDIAEDRLKFWISRIAEQPTSHDAVDVERGMRELRKLGIEQQLWEASRAQLTDSTFPLSVSDYCDE